MNHREKIESVFGIKSLDHALFYNHKGSLRFELSEGGSYINMFTKAFNKASNILEAAICGSNRVIICLAFYGENTLLSSLSVFKSIKDCQISIPKSESEIWQKECPSEECMRTFIAFPIKADEVHKFLWGALAGELGIRPRLKCDAYLIDLEKNILLHPYDDRGMDIIGPNKAFLKELFISFNENLLDYDIKEMNEYFNAL